MPEKVKYRPNCTCLIPVPINVKIPSCHINTSLIFIVDSLRGSHFVHDCLNLLFQHATVVEQSIVHPL